MADDSWWGYAPGELIDLNRKLIFDKQYVDVQIKMVGLTLEELRNGKEETATKAGSRGQHRGPREYQPEA